MSATSSGVKIPDATVKDGTDMLTPIQQGHTYHQILLKRRTEDVEGVVSTVLEHIPWGGDGKTVTIPPCLVSALIVLVLSGGWSVLCIV